MYTVEGILAAAGVANTAFTKEGVTVRLTSNNQLIGTYSDLEKFRKANYGNYEGWDAHHILEDQDVLRLGLARFSPANSQMICVLIPNGQHKGINRDLRKWNPPRDIPTAADLELAYKEAYRDNLDNYCGADSETALRQELLKILHAVLHNLLRAATMGMMPDLQQVESKIRAEKGLHEQLVRGSSPNPLQTAGFLGSMLNPITAGAAFVNPANRSVIGAGVNLLNPKQRPELSVWNKAEANARAARQALSQGDPIRAATSIALAKIYCEKARVLVKTWRDGIDLAGRRAELLIGAAAAVAMIAAGGYYLVGAAGGGATVGATVGAATEGGIAGTTETGPRIFQMVRIGTQEIMTAETLEGEQIGEGTFNKEIPRLLFRRRP